MSDGICKKNVRIISNGEIWNIEINDLALKFDFVTFILSLVTLVKIADLSFNLNVLLDKQLKAKEYELV